MANERVSSSQPTATGLTVAVGCFQYSVTRMTLSVQQQQEGSGIRQAAIDFTSGCAGGVALILAGQPMDTVKVKMQAFPNLHSNMRQCFFDTLRNEGMVRGLYAGTAPALVAAVSEISVMMLMYGQGQRLVASAVGKKDLDNLSVMENAIAGAFSGIFTSFSLCPTEHVKCRMQTIRQTEAGLGQLSTARLAKHVLQQDGFKNLFRGLVPTMFREVPGCFFFFLGVEGSKEAISQVSGTPKAELGFGANLLAGGFAGITFWVSIFPPDT